MSKHRIQSLAFILLPFLVSGCVSIPEQTQLITMDGSSGLKQVQADCIYNNEPDSIKVSTQSDTELDANNISLLNWNIYKAQRENWTTDFNQLIQHQDIVLLQEAVLKEKMYQPLNQQQLKWNLNTAFYYDEVETGVLTASIVRPLRSCGLRTNEPIIRTPKTTLVSEYRLSHGGQNLLVANIHGINFSLGTEVYQQQIDALIHSVQHHNGPLVIAGDFNSWSDERMAIIDQMAEQLSLQAVTYQNQNRLTLFGHALDHVFYRNLELVKEESIKVTSSDHNPIKVTFKVPTSNLAQINHEN